MGKAEALKDVHAAIASNKVLVYSKSSCSFCKKAKEALNQFLTPEQYTVIEIDKNPDLISVMEALLEITGNHTVPRVFINGRFLGGGDDTAKAAADGSLKKLLVDAGVLED
ncbi:hypothetical protein HYH03_014840 [Edaphochlamys debaryana]|uniref:Glutaredoxin domain-containing protein n=1 Tax=Edaphochlamys debaryana TaxID=47281 RepID=A0A835XN22_9CHLO|nr:hypothetical protein HYH03_014840 [Edaphochlamys debaryana]|eukprot:KAG2486539.1 hypothetical protein HYH03_014840 [Edaphochlamys debaryana]